MDVSNMLVEGQAYTGGPLPTTEAASAGHLREIEPTYNMLSHGNDIVMTRVYPTTETDSAHDSLSPTKSSPSKQVSFELLLPQSPQHRARLPMRVNIFPHDTTESIITTVKNFYGLYERRGVVFQDAHGNTLIARYENFDSDMTVYVRVTAEEPPELDEYTPGAHQHSLSPRRPRLDEPFQMLPPSLARPDLHKARGPSYSPQPGRGRRSASATANVANAKPRGRPATKSRGTSSHGSFAEALGGDYSDSDGGNASVTSSRRSKKEQVASAEISLDNIVEGGRRKRAKFDSSELPLFVPPQVPMTASISSVSPQRRISGQNPPASPFSYTNQHTFAYSHPLPSPQSNGYGDVSYGPGISTPYSLSTGQASGGYRARTRGSAQYVRQSGNSGYVMPTPDPTVGSVISDEDVARQLMRLGDASNFSSHGRTSTSTLDDAFSGKADAASSSDESESDVEGGQELPPLPYAMGRGDHVLGEVAHGFDSGDTSDDYEDNRDDSFKGDSDEIVPDEQQGLQLNGMKRPSILSKASKPSKPRAMSKGKGKSNGGSKPPMSPTSLASQSRKASNASLNLQAPLGADEEDLSSKPRCQRCRKSKKGCDRQRPCQRCKDAGIGIEGCISEDEGNGRKGRYGRHMGVPVKKTQMEPPSMIPSAIPSMTDAISSAASALEKSKKRKR